MKRILQGGMLVMLTASLVLAQPGPASRIDPEGVAGELLLCESISDRALDRFLSRAGANLLVLTAGKDGGVGSKLRERIKGKEISLEVRPVNASDDGTVPDLKMVTGVWLAGEQVDRLRQAIAGTALEEGLQGVLQRGGIVAGSGSAAALLARAQTDTKKSGCDLLPGALVEVGTSEALTQALARRPALVGYRLLPGAVLSVRGRALRSLGTAPVQITLAKGGRDAARSVKLAPNEEEDLTALRRAARDRATNYPPAKVPAPVVEKGTLVIIGGGGMPVGMVGKFVEMAGGKAAKIVVFPTANPDPLPKRDGLAEAFRKAGAKVTILPSRKLAEVESKEYVDALKEATGIWFGGGRQWRFVDAYEGTTLVPLMFEVLKRGGVIGGSSAGATIQGEYLCRGGVFDNFAIAYEGYERGLNFLPGTAIDQHFAQRKRFKDMTDLMKRFPQYLGIGLDEATAIVVRGSMAEVVGRGQVHFYDATRKAEKDASDHESLGAGGKYDLVQRKVVTPATKK